MSKLAVGILGGMGPFATSSFFEKLLKLSPAKKDWEHLRIIIDNNPHIPSRSRAYTLGEESPVESMLQSCIKLQNYPVDIIALPCNSATYYIDEFKDKLNIPLLNIVEITSNRIAEKFPGGNWISVFGGIVTYSSKLYKPFLEKRGFEYVDHDKSDQDIISGFIEEIKLHSDMNVSKVNSYIKSYKEKYNPDKIILGCTEFGCLNGLTTDLVLIDSVTEYASHIVSLAYGV